MIIIEYKYDNIFIAYYCYINGLLFSCSKCKYWNKSIICPPIISYRSGLIIDRYFKELRSITNIGIAI